MRLPIVPPGPLPPLPAPLDAAARVWAATAGRTRLLVRAAVTVTLLLAASGGLVRGPWGTPTPVVVTTRTIAAGEAIAPEDVEVARRPSQLVPHGSLTDLATVPPDARAAGPLPAGSVLSSDQLHAEGPAGLATSGTAVVAFDATMLPAVPVGTRLDVAVPSIDGSAAIAARAAVVVADDGTWRWLRVARADVPAVAAGIADGRLVAAVLPDVETGRAVTADDDR